MRSDAALPRQRALERQLLLFFLFSAAGWVWEVALGVVTTGQVINRGFLRRSSGGQRGQEGRC